MVEIRKALIIPDEELSFEYARSSGPGGQNVNKVNTKVTLRFDVDASRSLSDDQRVRIKQKLHTRISKEGVLRVTSQRHRTQRANQEALARRRKRRKTKTPAAAHQRRLEDKKRRSALKKERGKILEDD
jgi:ribosome-associated protein